MEKGKLLIRDNFDGFGGIKFQPSIEVTSCNNGNVNKYEKKCIENGFKPAMWIGMVRLF